MPDEDLRPLLPAMLPPLPWTSSLLPNSLMGTETQKTYAVLSLSIQAERDWIEITGTALLS